MKDKLKWLAAFAIPAFGYLMFETTTGNLLHISFPRAVINLIFYYFLYILVYLAVNQFRAAAAGTTVVLYILAAADYYVLQFKGAPLLLPQDLTAWRTAAAVVSNYHITFAKSVACGAVLLILMLLLIWRLRMEKLTWKKRGIAAGCYVLCLTAWLLAFYRYDIKYTLAGIDDDVFWWSLEGSYQDFGYATSTAILAKSMIIEKPAGYSVSEAARIGETGFLRKHAGFRDHSGESDCDYEREPVGYACYPGFSDESGVFSVYQQSYR